MSLVRLNKYLSSSGITSRRKADELIVQGKVSVNGKVVAILGTQIDPDKDSVSVVGQEAKKDLKRVYLMLNKPRGIVSTVSDEAGRPTVMGLIQGVAERVYPVGRLDIESEGLLLLTNDGELTNQLIHPKFHISKTYHVSVVGQVTEQKLLQLSQGVRLKEGVTARADVTLVTQNSNQTTIQMILYQGWNRQIRRMCGVAGLTVEKLVRVAIGPLNIGDLPKGEWRYLTGEERNLLTKKE